MPNVTLEEAVDYARRWEALQDQIQLQRGSADSVNHAQPRQRFRGKSRGRGCGGGGQRSQPRQRDAANASSKCSKCGYTYHKNATCPAVRAKCNKCLKVGHFASMCRSKADTVVCVSEDNYDDNSNADISNTVADNTPFLGAIKKHAPPSDPWFVTLKIGSNFVRFKIDTGADVTTMSEFTYKALQHRPQLRHSSLNLSSPGGKVNTVGEFHSEMRYKDTSYKSRIVVIKGNSDLLARDAAVGLKLVAPMKQN